MSGGLNVVSGPLKHDAHVAVRECVWLRWVARKPEEASEVIERKSVEE